jgi:D-3-phosphoglycerate dehydrogenase / 2-oxoglutarate reductase
VELLSLDAVCERADYLSLHAPATAETRGLFNAERLRKCKRGVRIVNTARGELIDEAALADAVTQGQVGGAGLDVFEREPPIDWRLTQLPQVIATPHIAASTHEAQEQVGIDTATAVRDYLMDGTVRNAVNFPAISTEDMAALRPFLLLAERLGALAAQLADGRTRALGIRHYGPLVSAHGELIVSAAVAGLLKPMLSSAVTIVNARDVAAQRGIEIVESRSSRPRTFANMLSVKLHTSTGECWLEGAVFEPGRPRITLLDGVEVEAPLEGTLLTIRNVDQPGVIGHVGSILGRHGVNIANFALGRHEGGAAGIVNVDAPATDERLLESVRDIRQVEGVREARLAAVS